VLENLALVVLDDPVELRRDRQVDERGSKPGQRVVDDDSLQADLADALRYLGSILRIGFGHFFLFLSIIRFLKMQFKFFTTMAVHRIKVLTLYTLEVFELFQICEDDHFTTSALFEFLLYWWKKNR
jgi:hypothetical protein